MSVDSILNAEQSALNKDQEIGRILSTSRWDYFAILEINPLAIDKEAENDLSNKVKRSYRKKTLSVHPDKVSNPKAPEAFDRLKKAELVLSAVAPSAATSTSSVTEITSEVQALINERERLVAIYEDAKTRIKGADNTPQLQALVAKILEDEIRSDNIDKEFEQRQEAQKLKELTRIRNERELKKKMQAKWEDDRDSRVKNWRNYSAKVEKKTKGKKKGSSKPKVLA